MQQPAHAADVVAQRMKAVERATQEGNWNTAQHLELISPEQGGMLDRDEQVFVRREASLEQKLRLGIGAPGKEAQRARGKARQGRPRRPARARKEKGGDKKEE